jgi:transglutaminase-like putative cysteine protease
VIGGFICKDDCRPVASAYHNWVEVYLEDRWRIVDPQNNIFMKNETDYIAVQITGDTSILPALGSSRHVITGDGLSVHLQ